MGVNEVYLGHTRSTTKGIAVSAIVGLVIAASPAVGEECTHGEGDPELNFNGYYVDVDCPDCSTSQGIVIYKEANDIPGLQREDPNRNDRCGDPWQPDRLVAAFFMP